MISPAFIDNVSQLFRKTEGTFGTRDFCFMSLQNWKKSIQDFSGSKEIFQEEIQKMVYLVKNTSPRIAFLIFMILTVVEQFEAFQKENPTATLEEEKEKLSELIDTVQNRRKQSAQKLIFASESIIQDGDVILLHDASHTLFDILKHAQSMGKKFMCMVAEQEMEKTALVINFLQKNNFAFQVVPEYLLSHVQEKITKMIVGATTVNSLLEVVADAGTSSIISQMHESKIPIYVSITTDKFSLWKAETHHSHKKQKHMTVGGVEYDKLVFSHDRFPIFLVDGFITNKGILTSEEVKNFYNAEYEKCTEWRGKYAV